MPYRKHKLYCYVDETGQDTGGRLFIVSVIISSRKERDALEQRLQHIEIASGKKKKKWQSSKFNQRLAYLEAVTTLQQLKRNLFAAEYETTKEYEALTTYTLAQAVNTVAAKADYKMTVIIDGLSAAARQRVMRHLRRLRIKYQKVVTKPRDESSALLRLADALAGLVRDYFEGEKYAKTWYRKLVQEGYLTDLKQQ